LELKCDAPLSEFAFNVNLRHLSGVLDNAEVIAGLTRLKMDKGWRVVGRCRLTL